MNTRFKYVVALVALLFTNLSLSKAQTTVEKAPKKIEVTGSAEEEVMPDKLYISITLKEYFKDKDNKARVDILTLEQQLQKAVADAGIAKENLTVGALNGSREWWGKKKPTNYL
ncbi:MAG: SIMPL domain-containing protein, partial [Flectobacillus sp.]|nr:SIMPL domain-containing protein [Flectobacillus sp.]